MNKNRDTRVSEMKNLRILFAAGFIAAACTATQDPLEGYEEVTGTGIIKAPAMQPAPAATQDAELIEHGRYLIELLGCPACHTPGALSGEPDFDRWLAYSELSDTDTAAMVAYLQSIPPIEHRVPDHVPPGSSTDEPFVHFGIYRSR